MRTLTINIERGDPFAALEKSFEAGLSSTEYIGEFISFPNAEFLWKKLSAKRMQIIEAMAGVGEMTMREVSRRVNRDFKAVHADLLALIDLGIVERSAKGVLMPFDEIHLDLIKSYAA